MSRSPATAATGTRTSGSVTAQDRIRQSVVIASTVVAIVGSFIGSGAAGGTPIQDAVGGALSADSTLIAPAGPAFSIWSVIYAGLIAYAIWQALHTQAGDNRQRRVGYWVAASLLLNGAWILSVQFGSLGLSAVMIVALLVVLIVAFIILRADRPRGWIETVVLDGTMGFYLGWVTIATVANLTALFVSTGFRGFGIPADAWGVALVAVAAAIGILLAFWDGGRLAPSASLSWGLAWVSVSRLTGELVSVPTAVAAGTGAAAVVLVTVIVRLAQKPDTRVRYRGRREATSSSTASEPA
ncbi:MAG TPA: TspO/MBR family protein [Glaciibacter sp.]|nr:TspO/MBR family protein [Glaciibacter sp.]